MVNKRNVRGPQTRQAVATRPEQGYLVSGRRPSVAQACHVGGHASSAFDLWCLTLELPQGPLVGFSKTRDVGSAGGGGIGTFTVSTPSPRG